MAGLGTILKSASGIAVGLLFLISVVFPPYQPHLLLARATAGYMLAAVSIAYAFIRGRRYFIIGAAISAAIFLLSFAYVDWMMLLAPVSLLFYIALGWLYFLYAAWKLGGWRGFLVFFAVQIAFLFVPTPSLQFANLLPDEWLRLWGDRPEATYFNWARYIIFCITNSFSLYLAKTVGVTSASRTSPGSPP